MKRILMIAALMVSATMVFAEGKPQALCPVMKDQPVNEDSRYVDVEGYRIYVCCGGCVKAVTADPAKFIAEMKAEGVELEQAPDAQKEN